MTWVKEANKLGKYEETYDGFRIYVTKEPQVLESSFEEDGSTWLRTDFVPGEFVAIDRDGVTFTRRYLTEIYYDIDLEMLRRRLDKRERRYNLRS